MSQSLHSLLHGVGLPIPIGLSNPVIEGLTSDSRCIGKSSLFFGLPGQKVNGGLFWRKALEDGAVAAVIGSEAANLVPPGPEDIVLVVPSPVEEWVGKIAAFFWQNPSSALKLIGVTGTNGKTTTSYLIEYLASAIGRPSALFGTLVNRWPSFSSAATHTTGFADTLQAQLAAALEAGAEFGAIEVSSHALDQKRVAGCRFAGAIFTNLTQDHLDYHNSMEAYFQAKSLLFQSPLLNSADHNAVINIDNEWGALLAKSLGKACWRSSLAKGLNSSKDVELYINNVEITSRGIKGDLHSPLGQGSFESPLLGRFNLMNLLQAVGVLLQQGLPLASLLEAVADFPGVPGRMERIKLLESEQNDRCPKVLVDYAHTPDGLKNALISLRPFVNGKLICVFGCGGDRDRGKRSKMGRIAAEFADQIILTSDNPRTEDPMDIINQIILGIPSEKLFSVEVDRAVAIRNIIAESFPGDVVLIAGKGHEDYQIIGTQKIHLDDREMAYRALLESISSE